MSISDVLGALKGQRKTAETLAAKLTKLEAERNSLLSRPPDRDAVLSWALRAVDRAETDFAQYLQDWYFKEDYVARVPSAWFETDPGPRWLERQQRVPGMLYDNVDGAMIADADFDRKALMAILAPQLRHLIPQVIDKHFPLQRDGMSAKERMERVAKIDQEIADVNAERAKLATELRSLRDGINEIV